MGLDIMIFEKCAKCSTVNEFELHRSEEGEPFEIQNDEHWRLLNEAFEADINELRQAFKKLSKAEREENRDEMREYIANLDEYHNEIETPEHAEEFFYVAANLKFIDDGAFNFLKCEKCGTFIDFYVVSA
jgi:uncharacterized protein YjcR